MPRQKQDLKITQKKRANGEVFFEALKRLDIPPYGARIDGGLALLAEAESREFRGYGATREEAAAEANDKAAAWHRQHVTALVPAMEFIEGQGSAYLAAANELGQMLPRLARIFEEHPSLAEILRPVLPDRARRDGEVAQFETQEYPISIKTVAKDSASPILDGRTLNDAIHALLTARNGISTSRKLRSDYHGYWRNHIQVKISKSQERPLGEIPLSQLKLKDLEAWRDGLLKERDAQIVEKWERHPAHEFGTAALTKVDWKSVGKASPSSIKKYRHVITAAITKALNDDEGDWGITRNVAAALKIKMTKSSRIAEYVPTLQDYQKLQTVVATLLDGLPDVRLAAYLALIRNCIRPSEICSLRPHHYEIKTGRLLIEASTDAYGEESEGGKSGSIDEQVIIEADRHYIEAALKLEGEFLLPSYSDLTAYLRSDSTDKPWAKALELAELSGKGLTPYRLKHAQISDMVARGFSIEQILSMTRHTTAEMIRKHYRLLHGSEMSDAYSPKKEKKSVSAKA